MSKQISKMSYSVSNIEREYGDSDENHNNLFMKTVDCYGFNGDANDMLPALPVVICRIASGRRLIGMVNNVLTEKFNHSGVKIVYNDTDSSMISLDVISCKINHETIAKEMGESINVCDEKLISLRGNQRHAISNFTS